MHSLNDSPGLIEQDHPAVVGSLIGVCFQDPREDPAAVLDRRGLILRDRRQLCQRRHQRGGSAACVLRDGGLDQQ